MKYYKELALKLFDNGFQPIPIRPKSKAAFMDKGESWQGTVSREKVNEWVKNGKGGGGVGITNVVGLDIDIKDKKICKAIVPIIKDIIGEDLAIRVGEHPKFLVMLHPDSAVSKKIKWVFNNGEVEYAIEILNPGDQYFVAYGVHPDTNKEYNWVKKTSPLNMNISELPVLDELGIAMLEDAVTGLMVGFGFEEGFINGKKGKPTRSVGHHCDEDGGAGAFLEYKPPGQDSPDRIKTLLANLPKTYCDNRDEWIRIGSAVHHGTGGSDDGFKVFDEWSRTSEKYKGITDTRGRWDSFDIGKSGGGCATIGTIIHILQKEGLYDDIKEQVDADSKNETSLSYEEQVASAKDKKSIRKIMKQISKDQNLDNLQRSDLAKNIHDHVKVHLAGAWKVSDIARMIACQGMKEIDTLTGEEWLEGWYFLLHQNKFARAGDTNMLQRAAFNGLYNRLLVDRLELEKKHQEADRYALEIKKIECATDLLYFPGAGDVFEFNGQMMVNSFNPSSWGTRLAKNSWKSADTAAIDMMLRHIYEMFNQSGEAELLLNAMRHIVQNPEIRLRWALVMYGCEGDGKTTIARTLARAVGPVNAGIVNGSDIVSSPFSDWAAGQVFKIIEELKVPGKNRFETIERIKAFITNDIISINPKYQAPKVIPNTSSLFATTNHRDAIPYQADSRRFTLITSKWTSNKQISDEYGTGYFTKMINMLEQYESAINEYLATSEIDPLFDPHRLPTTPSLLAGIHAEKSELMIAIEDIVSGGTTYGVTSTVVIMQKLRAAIEKEIEFGSTDLEFVPPLGDIKRCLKKMGYVKTTKQFTVDGRGCYPWTKDLPSVTRGKIIEQLEKNSTETDLLF